MDDIVRKIAALMAKANGTENEHEAATFAAKAQEMLTKHNLSEMDVLKQSAEARGEVVGEMEVENKYATGWRVDLMGAVCRFYFCKLLLQRHGEINTRGRWVDRTKFIIVGKAHNAAIASSMFTYLEKTTLRLAREWMRAHDGDRSEQLNFERGCGLRLTTRLNQLAREQREAKAVAGYTGTTLPALYDNESKAIEEFLADKVLGKARRRGSSASGRGGMAGYAAGGAVSLGTQVSQAKSQKLLG